MSLKHAHDIFESPSQHVDHVDPERLGLLQDRLLVRDLGEDEHAGSIVIPESARGKSRYRVGLVVATGPGNRFIEAGITDDGIVRRRLITSGKPCPCCKNGRIFSLVAYRFLDCHACYGTGKIPLTVPCDCKPGDRILYEVRKEAEIFINGVRHGLMFEEQAVIGVFEGD